MSLIPETAANTNAGRLAVEQVYGYMVRNQKALGVITTMTGWVFLKRENGSRLLMTPLLGCGDFNTLVPRGYSRPGGYTISQALYFFSALAEATPDLPETIGSSGYPVQRIPEAMSSLAPSIPHGFEFNYANFPPAQGATGQYPAEFQWVSLVFEPWKTGNQLGHKTWLGNFDERSEKRTGKVVIKLWDSWKFNSKDRDNEVAVYKRLQSLWGICVPALHAVGPLGFSHSLVIDYIDHVFSLPVQF
jgi:hypothetical protein